MSIETADIVTSLNGRDKDKSFLVMAVEEEYCILVDGKGRRIDKPKRKKNKHLKFEGKADDRIAEKLRNGEKITNNEIRLALVKFNAEKEEGGM
jgi:ribosomal protein L14E/L6E/L27E